MSIEDNFNLQNGKCRDHSVMDIKCPICGTWDPKGADHNAECAKELEAVIVYGNRIIAEFFEKATRREV